jgi:hypothetical protein
MKAMNPEQNRMVEDERREKNWKRWGPYLPERQWGTVREDYSEGGDPWNHFTHDQARSRAYRWGEDGLLGLTDRQGRMCFSIALWNGKDPILKERLFGLGGPEGNHGEDVKECYYYLDSTPTHSYMKALYKYPQREYPYTNLVTENKRRDRGDPEYELLDCGIFNEDRYFDVFVEYCKASPNDILVRITVTNRGPEKAQLNLLGQLWFRNTWSWGRSGEGYWPKPLISMQDNLLVAEHKSLGRFYLNTGLQQGINDPEYLFTDNETNTSSLYGAAHSGYRKDAFHEYIVGGNTRAVNPDKKGTKSAVSYKLDIPEGESVVLKQRLTSEKELPEDLSEQSFDSIFNQRILEADEFYESVISAAADPEEKRVLRQGFAGLLWSKQFYHYSVKDWLEGDSRKPGTSKKRNSGRNHDWVHLYNRDVISMPDKWEYPWYAAWDLAFHMIPFARLDPHFTKHQLILMLREWYMHPNGQIPAYEWSFSDVNPPVHAWAVWRVYKMTGARGERDHDFLARAFQKLLLNFTWWVNRKDIHGKHLFSGGFLGLDNIGVFDRSKPLPTGGHLDQADGTAWMAFYCITMLAISLELAQKFPVYEDVASKYFEHFMAITDAINSQDELGLWDEKDGFYYDHLHVHDHFIPLRFRSMVGLLPLIAVENLEEETIDRLPGFKKRMTWFLENRTDLVFEMSSKEYRASEEGHCHRHLALCPLDRLKRVLRYLLDENEFLSPYGIRSLSRIHRHHPYIFKTDGSEYRIDYVPGESDSALFGGNSNWRGPIWFPVNYLLIEALERYHHFYGDSLMVEFPIGSGNSVGLDRVAYELSRRLASIFMPDREGRRPCNGRHKEYATDSNWKDLVLFYEYFNGDSGDGLGASHQTGWTALVTSLIQDIAKKHGPKS